MLAERDVSTDRRWADRFELETGFWWRVFRVEQHVTVFYRGYSAERGVYHMGDCYDPEPLWASICETQDESRRWAIRNGVRPLPPVLSSQLPVALRSVDG
ncbi:hypothetical protein [Nonomuraea ceibae]|uniref:hypothetical protein n=1 Tax=Nonomuraea ceibae TaxID=1935170 RepID=UPI001C60158E|nr:hypothetical protein [Nonomuraea ceibae]